MRNKTVSQFMIFILSSLLTACSLLRTIGDEARSIEELDALWAQPSDLQPAELLEGERLKVVATTTIVGDVVSFIGGNEIELIVLMPFNIDPHSFEPTTSDLRAMSEADVVFINGLGLELPLYEFLESVVEEVAVISLSDGISIREVKAGSGEGEGEPGTTGIDPHVWFDPANVNHWADRINRSLSVLVPSKSAKFDEHTDTYSKFLDGLDEWIEERVSQVPEEKRIIVSDHYIFGYFTQRYGFETVGAVIPVYSSAAEPSAQEIANLEETISEIGVGAIFVGESFSSAAANSLAKDTGVQLIKLYTGSLSDPDGSATSYLNMMQYNVNQIVNALLE